MPLPGHPALLVLCGSLLANTCTPRATAQSAGSVEQKEAPVAAASSTESSEIPEVPGISGLLRGVNAGVTLSGTHDSFTGWATIVQPALGFSFNDTFSFDVTIPIYMYRLAESRSARPRPNQQLVNQRAEPGDLIFSLHADFLLRSLAYQATVSATAPTGDSLYGLTSGRATFDLTNHFEYNLKWVTPNLELGIGDSSTLAERVVRKNYTSLGPLSHFQLGLAFPLPHGLSFQTSAYEQLPVGDQKIYESVKRGRNTTTVVVGRDVTEDNGFNTSLELPVDRHMSLSGSYSRSLRFRDDIVSVGVTYILRGPRQEQEQAVDAALLRSLQQETPAPESASSSKLPPP